MIRDILPYLGLFAVLACQPRHLVTNSGSPYLATCSSSPFLPAQVTPSTSRTITLLVETKFSPLSWNRSEK